MLFIWKHLYILHIHFEGCEDDMAKWFLANGEWTGDLVGKPDNQRLIIERDLKVFGENWNNGYKVVVRKVCICKQETVYNDIVNLWITEKSHIV